MQYSDDEIFYKNYLKNQSKISFLKELFQTVKEKGADVNYSEDEEKLLSSSRTRFQDEIEYLK